MTEPPTLLEPILDLLRRAQACHAQGRLDEAQALYRQILDRQPDQPQALSLLAMILVDRGDDAEAEAVVLRHLAVRPNDGASSHLLGQLRARQGDDPAAVEQFQRAAQWRPGLAPIHNDLGVALHRLGRNDEAMTALERAVELDPEYGAARGNLGVVLLELGRFGDALDALLVALAHASGMAAETRASVLDNLVRAARKAGRLAEAEAALRAEVAAGHDDADTIEQLALALEQSNQTDRALALRNALARRTGVKPGGRAGAKTTVLVLGAAGAGHIPIRYLLDTDVFATMSVSLLSPGEADAPLGPVDLDALRRADVVFSTLGDIDRDGGQLAAAETLCGRLGKPVINAPGGIHRTGRDGAPALFGDIAGMVTPVIERMAPQELARRDITSPILARPAGDHGGDNLVLLRNGAERDAWLATRKTRTLLVSPFHNFRSADGHWRKYRLIFVDRQVFPYHLAISDDWLVHYWRAEMGRSDWKKAEEERFLTDWRGVFGAAASAVDETALRLDLDYGGMDCALLPDGRLLLFEANACMLVHLDEAKAAFPYKHLAVPPIRDAFTAMVRERVGNT